MNDIGASVMDERVATLDLSFINKRLEQAGHTPAKAERSVEEYRRFIAVLAAEPNAIFVPTKAADAAWHEHILFMERYESDMLRIVGGRAYHHPEAPDAAIWHEGVANTQREFRRRFGVNVPEQDLAACFVTNKAA